MTTEATAPNAQQILFWNDTAGAMWVALEPRIGAQLRPLGLRAMAHAAFAAGERVLDVGCGAGETTREIARRVGPSGTATGIDVSGPMLALAREGARAEGVANVVFEQVDAQTAALPAASFDVLFSRFGVMFFDDPPAAFANLRRALAPGARLVFVCWRGLRENPWMSVPLAAAAKHLTITPPAPGAPGPLAFADPRLVHDILGGAGFKGISIEALDELLTIGGPAALEDTVDFLTKIGPAARALREADPEMIPVVREAIREAVTPYHGVNGLCMAGAAWLVTAKNEG